MGDDDRFETRREKPIRVRDSFVEVARVRFDDLGTEGRGEIGDLRGFARDND